MTARAVSTAGRARLVASLAVIIVAGAGTIATTPAAPSASADGEFSFRLTAQEPLLLRRVTVSVEPGAAPIEDVALLANSDDAGFPPDYWLSIVPEDPDEPSVVPRDQFGLYSADAGHGMTPVCALGCQRSYLLVVRAVDPTRSVADLVNVRVAIYESPAIDATPDPANARALATLRVEAAQPELATSFVRTAVNGRLAIDGQSGRSTWAGSLHVPATSLQGGAAYTLGGLWIEGDIAASDDDTRALLKVSVGDVEHTEIVDLARPIFTISQEWHTFCAPAADCDVPVRLDLSWDCFLLCPAESKSIDWRMEARLEYLGLAEPPPGATIDLTEQP